MKELTIEQACTAPANFMYVWADEKKFLQYIKPKWATIIRGKKANQIKILTLSAEKYLGNANRVQEYYTAIENAFKSAYGMHPLSALSILAQGGTVAGKNWKEGVYGIGAVLTFAGHSDITVREADGHILQNGEDKTDTAKTVYANVGGTAVAYQLFATIDNITYMSQYNKTTKKYYAQSFSTEDNFYSARTGNQIESSDSADVWGSIQLALEKFINWILSIFGYGVETITAANTAPNQLSDGFATTESGGMSEASGILLALAAGGFLLAGGLKGKKNKKAK